MSYIGYKPADKPLTSADITDGIISSADIANGAITSAKLASGVGGETQEVGTWTPTWSLAGGSITSIDTTSYSYVKVGRIVVAQVQAHLNTSSGSGQITFTLPFTTSGNGSFVGTEYGQAGLILYGQYADNTTSAGMAYTGSFTQNGYFRATVIYRSAT